MADPSLTPQQQPPPPAAPGFKLKLKLGGSSGGASTTTIASPVASTSGTSNTSVLPPSRPQSAAVHPQSEAYVAPTSSVHDAEEIDELDGGDDDFPPSGDVNDGAYGVRKRSKSKKKGSATPVELSVQDAPLNALGTPNYDSSIGSIVIPPSGGSTSKKKKKAPAPALPSLTPSLDTAALNNPNNIPGVGRAWRKGMKGYSRPDSSLAPAGEYTPPVPKRKRPTYGEDLVGEEIGEEFMPTMVAPGGLATSEKWVNGLPGGNEQSRATAAMASAVNKVFPVGQPPKTGSGFLTALPLDKNTPKPRSWKKAKREVLGPSGYPMLVSVWVGDEASPYAEHMITHPRPPPVEKKPVVQLDIGSPHPGEGGNYAASEAGGSVADEGEAAAPGVKGKGGKARGGKAAAPRKKPGPPKKAKAVPPPIGGAPLPAMQGLGLSGPPV